MAQIPRLISQSGISNIPGVRVRNFETSESLGGGIGGAIQSIANDALQTADAVAVMDAERKVKEKRLDLLYNKDNGAYNVKGKNALGLSGSIDAELAKSIEETEKTLMTPKQKATFRQRTASMRPETKTELDRYGLQQAKEYETAATKAYKASAFDEATRYYNNPIKIQENVQKIWDANLIEYKDQPVEALEFANKADQSKVYTSATTLMIDDNPLVAQKFFEQNKDLFLGEDAARIQRMLEPKVMQYNALAKADTIMSSSDDPKEWRAQARNIIDINERQLVQARLKEEETLRAQESKRLEEETRDQAWNIVFGGGSIRTMPAPLLANLDAKDRKEIMVFEQTRAEGKQVSTDWATYEDLQQLPPAELMRTDLTKYYSALNETERKELIKKKANAGKVDRAIKPELTFEQQFSDTAPSMLFPASKESGNLNRQQKDILGRTRAAAAEEVSRQEKESGGFLNMQERQKVIDQTVMAEWRNMQKVEVNRGGFFDTKVPISKLETGEWANIDFEDTALPPMESIPVSSRNAIAAYAKEVGITLTDEQIQRVFLLSQVSAPDEVIEAVLRGNK